MRCHHQVGSPAGETTDSFLLYWIAITGSRHGSQYLGAQGGVGRMTSRELLPRVPLALPFLWMEQNTVDVKSKEELRDI